jgi:hemerythrin-like domain-containing protein
MKATLEFKLPEEQHEHEDALKGSDWRWAVGDLTNYLRNELKHVDHSAEEYAIFDKVRDQLSTILEERDLRVW